MNFKEYRALAFTPDWRTNAEYQAAKKRYPNFERRLLAPVKRLPNSYINSFMVGADPEISILKLGATPRPRPSRNSASPGSIDFTTIEENFVSAVRAGIPVSPTIDSAPLATATIPEALPGEKQQCSAYGMTTGLCVGADGAARLVELRPKPAISVFEVVASLLAEMRLLAVMLPKDSPEGKYILSARAITDGEGVGGHIHMGRLTNENRSSEIAILDKITDGLERSTGLMDREGSDYRRRNTSYGHFNTVRNQEYGYEYRTPPTWLHSPTSAMVVLTMAKVGVSRIKELSPWGFAKEDVIRILANYKFVDRDCAIALSAILAHGSEFDSDSVRETWGIDERQGMSHIPARTLVLPSVLEPAEVDMNDLFNHLYHGQPLGYFPVENNRVLTKKDFPNFLPAQHCVNTYAAGGLGEATWDMYIKKATKEQIGAGTHGLLEYEVSRVEMVLPLGICVPISYPVGRARMKKVLDALYGEDRVAIETCREGVIKFTRGLTSHVNFRKLVLSGVLPFHTRDQVEKEEDIIANHGKQAAKKKSPVNTNGLMAGVSSAEITYVEGA